MKVLYLAGGSSIHTIRWVNALVEAGVDTVLVTQHNPEDPISPLVRVRRLPHSGGLGYFRNVPTVRRILAEEKPDLINAHYASGYGTTARLAGFAPTLLSVWGSDVYDFPMKSPLHRWWLRGNLKAATHIASTSHAMAAQTRRIAPELDEIAVTPFGVETDIFAPGGEKADTHIVIGTVKVLKEKYGIDTFIDSAALLIEHLRRDAPSIADRIRVRIVGDGPLRHELEQQTIDRGLGHIVQFVGRVPHAQVPVELQKLDIYVALSRMDSESFGVAIIEAGACGLPVVVSDAGGLPEVVADGETGFVVSRENPRAAADALYRLVLDASLRQRMGEAARRRVISLYEWRANVRQMIDLYEKITATKRRPVR